MMKNKFISHIKNLIFLPKAIKFLNRAKIDLVNSNTSIISFGFLLAKKLRVRHYWHLREFGDTDFGFIHNFNFKRNNNYNNNYISISESVKNHWISKGLNQKNIKTIYNGFSFNNPFVDFKINKVKRNNFLFIGSISEKKGHFLLIKSLASMQRNFLANIRIDIVGCGTLKNISELKKQIQIFDLDNVVKLLGYIDNSKINFDKYSFGLNLSFSEAFGRVNLEYIQNGLLPILPLSGAGTEIVFPNYPFLFDSNSHISLINTLQKCMIFKDKDNLLRELYTYASKRFNNDKMLKDLLEYYDKPQ